MSRSHQHRAGRIPPDGRRDGPGGHGVSRARDLIIVDVRSEDTVPVDPPRPPGAHPPADPDRYDILLNLSGTPVRETEVITVVLHHSRPDTPGGPGVRVHSHKDKSTTLFSLVLAFIEARIGDLSLDARMIASAHHVGVRTLHRMFQRHGCAVAGYIRERRLTHCRRDLADRSLAAESIRAIATRWGFADAAHFSRVFRAAYGVPPQAFRQQHMA